MTMQESVSPDVIDAIKTVIEDELRPFGLSRVKVSSGEDHDGDPILDVDVRYSRSGPPIDLRVITRLTTKVRDRLWSLGERRFPHIRHHFRDNQELVGHR